MTSFYIVTFGCKVNQAESGSIAKELKDGGWIFAPDVKSADCVIINSCTVTGRANMQARQAVRHALRENPKAVMAVTGCYAQTSAEELLAIPGIDYLAGNNRKHELCAALLATNRAKNTHPVTLLNDIAQEKKFAALPFYDLENRNRPFLKIQDGCNAFCAYCAVPYARGRSRSMPQPDVIAHINKLYADGFKEVVLTGIHVGKYGHDFTQTTDLALLLKTILAETDMPRLRISSIESMEITDELLDIAVNNDRICPHWHIPLQSGDDAVLRRMERLYNRAEFRRTVENVHKLFPQAAIGSDVLVGFPGEQDANFANTLQLIEDLPFTYLHVFPFSVRPNTKAATFTDKIPADVIKKRCQILRKTSISKKTAFYNSAIGQTVTVLVESKRDAKTGLLKGFSDNYLPLLFAGSDDLKNTIVNVRINELLNTELFGEICN